MVNLIVWYPTESFRKWCETRFSVDNSDEGMMQVYDYRFGRYGGIIGLNALRLFNGEWMAV